MVFLEVAQNPYKCVLAHEDINLNVWLYQFVRIYLSVT